MIYVSAPERQRIADGAGLHEQYLYQCLTGRRQTPAERCPDIEQASDFQITCEELRPDLRWVRVRAAGWPNGKPLLDVVSSAAPASATKEST